MKVIKTSLDLVYPQYKMLQRGNESLPYDSPKDDPETAINFLAAACIAGLNFSLLTDKPVGALILTRDKLWWSDAEFLINQVIYVDEEFRNSRGAVMLLNKAKEVAKNLGLPLQFSVTYGNDLQRKHDFLVRKGFTHLGGNYIME
jgi:GNAT superfamily N-acetyltransferase